jgi:tRNA(Arg) A34 adenosine deaminase TadA
LYQKAGIKLEFPKVVLQLPVWIESVMADSEQVYPTIEKRMELVIKLAQLNIEYKTGGPFGAGIFESKTGCLISVGVNLVESAGCSIAHAEMVAIAVAQRVIGSYDLGCEKDVAYQLVTSTEPCAMCLGAVPWSGVRSVVCGARDEDARSIGFDEGHKPANWIRSLESRRISVVRDVLREQAKAVLLEYGERGGLIYNTGHE